LAEVAQSAAELRARMVEPESVQQKKAQVVLEPPVWSLGEQRLVSLTKQQRAVEPRWDLPELAVPTEAARGAPEPAATQSEQGLALRPSAPEPLPEQLPLAERVQPALTRSVLQQVAAPPELQASSARP
jgi:hypothetical protein